MVRATAVLLYQIKMAISSPINPLIAIVGATGTGKSQVGLPCGLDLALYIHITNDACLKLAVELASRFNGEIISGDAMQLYDGLPIITNKITPEEMNGIPHHLLGCVKLEEEPWTVGAFTRNALRVVCSTFVHVLDPVLNAIAIRSRKFVPGDVSRSLWVVHTIILSPCSFMIPKAHQRYQTLKDQARGD